jgi:hypothetical protein
MTISSVLNQYQTLSTFSIIHTFRDRENPDQDDRKYLN